MRRAAAILVVLGAVVLLAPAAMAATPPWRDADAVKRALADAEIELVLGDRESAASRLLAAQAAAEAVLAGRDADLRAASDALAAARVAVAQDDVAALAAARATVRTTLLRAAFAEAVDASSRGDVASAREWLLIREFRPPTRFSRAGIEATRALDMLEEGRVSRQAAAAALRRDLLDTYDGLFRSALAGVVEAHETQFATRRAEAAALAAGYWSILRGAYVGQRGDGPARRADAALETLASAAQDGTGVAAAADHVGRLLGGFRAAPLSADEQLRRAGQLQRFLQLVPIEYDRGVSDGRVTLDFEIQEAITFRDGAAAALGDLMPALVARDRSAARRVETIVADLGDALSAASRGEQVAAPELVRDDTDEALDLLDGLYPWKWKEAGETADFDVISATLDRLQAAAASGDWSRAESARLEAYGVFELGPEQRLRGLAPSLFQKIEGYFWYGAGDVDGLVQLLKRKAAAAELAETRQALDVALEDAAARIGSGPQSRTQVVTNSAIIVFREGLEAVLILAALMASLVGPQRRHRRPLLLGAGLALLASGVTWVAAQTILTSLARFGERLEAVVSLVAIAVLLLILNWFYHRVYWQENLQGLHKKKKRILGGGALALAVTPAVGLVMLGFSSTYREGFETVLFLQAITLEAGPVAVLEGVALGLTGVLLLGFAVIRLERKLPHKQMLIATGILITWVLVVMVGTTVQTLQKVGWVAVTPVPGLELPYWAGLWLGLFPTWEGLLAQAAAAAFVIGSYVAAERLRVHRRALKLGPQTVSTPRPDSRLRRRA